MSLSAKPKTIIYPEPGSESKGKRLFKKAWEYGQGVDQATKTCIHTLDLFSQELERLRKKLREKCAQVLVLPCSISHKAEELLWKKGYYEIIQKCKQHRDVHDNATPLFLSYQALLKSADMFYNELLHTLETQTGVSLSQATMMQESNLEKQNLHWLRDIYYKCLIHLGDLARYHADVGGNPIVAIGYYHHAIALDCTQGIPYNQMAVMAGNRNENLDAVYYYQRSLSSPTPFKLSETNLLRIYEKNSTVLQSLQSKADHMTEPSIREFTKRLLLVRFLRLQQVLCPSEQSSTGVLSDKILGKLCEDIIGNLDECLGYDILLFQETCSDKVSACFSSDSVEKTTQSSPIDNLPLQLLLKFCALSILPCHSLRLLGSTHTPTATAFALTVFSQLLDCSHKRLIHLLSCALKLKTEHKEFSDIEIETLIQNEDNMVELLLSRQSNTMEETKRQSTGVNDRSSSVRGEVEAPSLSPAKKRTGQDTKPSRGKRKPRKMVDRRRRRKGARDELSSDSEEEVSSGEEKLSRSSSDHSLSMLSDSLGEDDLEIMESLSESSSSSEDETQPTDAIESDGTHGSHLTVSSTNVTTSPQRQKTGSKRQIVLAASFNLAPSNKDTSPSASPNLQASSRGGKPSSNFLQSSPKGGSKNGDVLLEQLEQETDVQTAVHSACCLIGEESYLMVVNVFAQWLQSYPIVIASCTQSFSTMWSRLASLLNFLPTEDQIKQAGLVPSDTSVALLEDMALRGFPPLVRSQETLVFHQGSTLTQLQQSISRVLSLHKFGQYLADARTAPAFTWNSAINRYVGPAQKTTMENKITEAAKQEEEKHALLNRSKLMKAMAHQRLQAEVATLTKTKAARTREAVFTPYVIPDAQSLCNGLHIIKKLLKTEKFVFVIAKSVIEALDNMKKGRENYTAREAIKFLEREFQRGNKFFRAQKSMESLNPGRRKHSKMDVQVWCYECLVDCANYFNQSTTTTETPQNMSVATLLMDNHILSLLDNLAEQEKRPQLSEVVQTAQQSGLGLETVLSFYSNWQAQNTTGKSKR